MRSRLEGAACAELNPNVVDHFFDVNPRHNRLMARAAINICGRCPVAPECLEDALNGPRVLRGTRAGLSAQELETARQWQRYETGASATGRMPRKPRPEWLPRSEAAEMHESTLVAADGDEAEGEIELGNKSSIGG